MTLAQKFLTSVSWNFVGKIAGLILGTLSSIVVARLLGPVAYGELTVLLAVIGTIPVFLYFGFEELLTIVVPTLVAKREKMAIRQLIWSALIGRVGIILLLAVVVLIFDNQLMTLFGHPEFTQYTPYIILSLIVSAITSLLMGVARSFFAYRTITITETLAQVSQLILVIVLLPAGYGVVGVLIAMLIGQAGAAIILGVNTNVFRSGLVRRPSFPRKHVRLALALWLVGLIGYVLGKQLDVIMLGALRVPLEEIGFYGLAFGFAEMLYVFSLGFGAIAQSAFSDIFGRSGAPGLHVVWPVVAKVEQLLIVPIYIFAVIWAPVILEGLYGQAFLAAVPIFRLLATLRIVYVATSASYASPVFYLFGRKKLAVSLRFLAGAGNFVGNLILIPFLGVFGAVWATGLSTAVIGVVEVAVVYRLLRALPPIGFFLKLVLMFGLSGALTLLLPLTGISALLIALLIYIALAIWLATWLKLFTQEEAAMVEAASAEFGRLVRGFTHAGK
ncbi:oligosaccharide flippase family protein [Candidatus Berkelbacteria bacterium]|nr:oligosaccharide flippase family protein [Candidatus Berkelbacteria bacterium]